MNTTIKTAGSLVHRIGDSAYFVPFSDAVWLLKASG